MKMDKLEAAAEIRAPSDVDRQLDAPTASDAATGPGAVLVGAALIVVVLPIWGVRILAQLIWRDLRRVGRLAGLFGSTYLEALRRS